MTASITWITPLSANTSVEMMVALLTFTQADTGAIQPLPSRTLKVRTLPCSVLACPAFTSAAITFPAITWSLRRPANFSLSFSKLSKVPAGSLAKASSVGANTVNGPGPLSASTNPAAFTAATKVLKLPAATAVSTISADIAGPDNPNAPAITTALISFFIYISIWLMNHCDKFISHESESK